MESNARIHGSSGVDATSNRCSCSCSCCVVVVVVECSNWVALLSSTAVGDGDEKGGIDGDDDDDACADEDGDANLSVAEGLDPGVDTGEVQGGVIDGETVMCFDDGEVDRMTV